MLNYTKKDIFILITLAVLYYLTGELSFWLLLKKTIVSVGVFIPEGIALAFALYFGVKVVPGIFIGQFILAFINMDSIALGLEIGAVNSLEALLAIFFFSKFKLDTKLNSFKDILGLLALSLLILEPFSAILGNMALFFHGVVTTDTLLSSISSWWIGNFMGQFLYTPFLLILFTNFKNLDINKYILYGVVYGAIVFALVILIDIKNPLLIMSVTLPILILAMSQEGIVYGSMMSVVLSLVAALSYWYNFGAFYLNSSFDNTINYNFFVLAHVLTTLTTGVLFEYKKHHEKNLQKAISEEVHKNEEQRLLMLQQSRLAQMGEMISMIAHQWRQPLNNLSLLNQLLITKYNKDKLDKKSMEYFKENSKKQIDLMSTTIDDFRNFFKNEKNKTDFCINDVLTNILDMTKPIYTNNSITIEYYIENAYKVHGYPNSLAQAILNIINNAKDAFLDKEMEHKIIQLKVFKKDTDIFIEIKDNAGGIDEDIIEKIFDPYFSTKQEKNGTGLGLYMSKMVIEEQLDANIYVANEDNGAKFTIRLQGDLCE